MGSQATVSVVCSGKGGVGVTSVCTQLALATAARGAVTLLVDLDVQKGGMLARHLGASAVADVLTSLGGDVFAGVSRIRPGVDLVSAPTDLARALAAGRTDVSPLIAAWQPHYAHIIIDIGNYLNLAGISALSMAHTVWLVTTADNASLDGAARMLQRLAALGMPLGRIEFVVNRARPPVDLPHLGVKMHIVPDDEHVSQRAGSPSYDSARCRPAIALLAERLSHVYTGNVPPTRTCQRSGRAGERLAT